MEQLFLEANPFSSTMWTCAGALIKRIFLEPHALQPQSVQAVWWNIATNYRTPQFLSTQYRRLSESAFFYNHTIYSNKMSLAVWFSKATISRRSTHFLSTKYRLPNGGSISTTTRFIPAKKKKLYAVRCSKTFIFRTTQLFVHEN